MYLLNYMSHVLVYVGIALCRAAGCETSKYLPFHYYLTLGNTHNFPLSTHHAVIPFHEHTLSYIPSSPLSSLLFISSYHSYISSYHPLTTLPSSFNSPYTLHLSAVFSLFPFLSLPLSLSLSLTNGSEQQHQYNGAYDQPSVPVVDCRVIERNTQEQEYDHLCNIATNQACEWEGRKWEEKGYC